MRDVAQFLRTREGKAVVLKIRGRGGCVEFATFDGTLFVHEIRRLRSISTAKRPIDADCSQNFLSWVRS